MNAMLSSGWSYAVAAITLINILACIWLLLWTSKKRPDEAREGDETGHVWDGDLREYNNPLPRWWLNMFVLTVIFGLVYLAFYPGLGNFTGRLGWTQHGQHDERLAEVMNRRAAILSAFDGRDVAALIADPAAQAQGAKLFSNQCAGCHGTDAQGAIGFPNLTDADWLYGGDSATVLTTLANGRNGMMPSFVGALSDEELRGLLALLADWNAAHARPDKHAVAIAKFNSTCAACHGADGHGNPMLGAPNLTDGIWLHGSSPDAIRATILYGRQGAMPAFGSLLSETERKLVAAWVLAQQPGPATASAASTPAAAH